MTDKVQTRHLGTKIRELRVEKNISLREVTGISAPFLSDIELGRRFPSKITLRIIADHLSIPFETLHELMLKDRPTVGSLTADLAKKDERIEAVEVILRILLQQHKDYLEHDKITIEEIEQILPGE